LFPVMFFVLFALVGLAFALDFRGIATRAARNSIWNRRSGRSGTALTLIQRAIGAIIGLVGVTMAVLLIVAGARS
jgi:ABC-type nickel/cobalt efflux system permease component RcnA